MRDFDPAPAARILAEAWRSGRLLPPLPDAIRPRTMAEGYAIQERLPAELGESVVGWKLGLSSAAAMRLHGLVHPLVGRVFGSRCSRSGSAVVLPPGATALVETEIAFVLAQAIAPDAPPDSLPDVIAAVHLAFELVLPRFRDGLGVGLPSFVADDAGFHALVLGPALDFADLAEVASTLVVEADGREAATALTGYDLADPIEAFAGLLAHAAEHRVTLEAGAIVSTGTVSAPFACRAPAILVARAAGREMSARCTVRTGSPERQSHQLHGDHRSGPQDG